MEKLKNIIYTASLLIVAATATYAAKEMVTSLKRFNDTLNTIDFVGIRREIRHLDELIQMRQE